jgi:hypothetical protein
VQFRVQEFCFFDDEGRFRRVSDTEPSVARITLSGGKFEVELCVDGLETTYDISELRAVTATLYPAGVGR